MGDFTAAGEAGVAGFGAAATAAGGPSESISSQTAAQTPQVWILLVEALHGWGPQFGQWCSLAIRPSGTRRATYPFRGFTDPAAFRLHL